MKKTIIFLILVLILVAGCVNLPSLSFFGNKQDQPTLGRGIRMYFLSGAPPTDRILISQGSKFLVRVGIDNYGPEVNGVSLKFWDNLPNGIGSTDQGGASATINRLEAAQFVRGNQNNPDLITQIIPSKAFFSPNDNGEVTYDPNMIAPGTKLNIFAELNIPNYDATIPASFCLKREADTNAPCSNQEIITSAKLGQVASYIPVTVDRIEKIATPFGEDDFFVDLKIVLKNLGGGDIFDINSGKKDILNSFDVTVDGLQSQTCSPDPRQGQLVFSNNEAVITCAVEHLKAGQSYTDHYLSIHYSFPYRMRIKVGPIPLAIIGQTALS